jgi:uncharacterized membrane protein
MMWIGLVLGLVVGAALAGLQGAVVAGFIGWLGGVIVQSHRKQAKDGAVPAKEGIEERMQRLERTVADLQARLARLAPAGLPASSAAAQGIAPVETADESVAAPLPVEPVAVKEPLQEPARPSVAPPSPPPIPPAPVQPNPIVAWLTGGNTIARVGLLILFFGLAFLLKYAADHSMLPVELRVAAVAAGGLALLVVGWRLRQKRPGYALGMQGAGVAVLYLTTFAALRLWGLIPAEAAFILLALIAAFAAFLAVAQDAMVLAVIAAGGGFLAPILASTGEGSHVMLFSYYLLLNVGIAAIALFKAWRALNVTGLLFTFFIGLAWGMRYYQPRHFDTTEPFLVAFFLLYVAIAVLYARKRAPELRHFVDGTVVFGAPLGAFGLQAALTYDREFFLAFSSLAVAALYLVLAAILHRTRRENWALLARAFLALGVVFATLAIPLALDARWTSAFWALEGAAIVWVGLRQRSTLGRAFGIALQLVAAAAYVEGYRRLPGAVPLLDAAFLGALLLAGAGMLIHRLLLAAREWVSRAESNLVPFLFVWGLGWWIFAWLHEIDVFVAADARIPACVGFFAATALVLGMLALRWQWSHAAIAVRWFTPVLAWLVATMIARGMAPHANLGWIAWPAAVAVLAWLLRKVEAPATYARALHAGSVWLLAALGAQELHWLAETYTARGTAWSVASVAVPAALLLLLASSRAADARWPVAAQPAAYRIDAPSVVAIAFAVWSLFANTTHDGRSDPLPYFPILNALDLAHVLAGLSLAAALMAIRRTSPDATPMLASRGAGAIAGAVAFVWLNGVLLRTLHHWADIPYTLYAMERSVLAQASLSVFWSVLALALMVFAARTPRRALWMVGAALMAVVVIKLFVVDLSNVGGIERIVSFIAVGLLMLVIGYFSPVPPRKAEVSP